ncbi:MAG: AMP-binding protein [Actinomycetota bacterium]
MSLIPGPRPVHVMQSPIDAGSATDVLAALARALDGSGPCICIGSAAPADTVASEIAVILHTSGSTGRPRPVGLTAAQLSALTSHVHDGVTPQWISSLPWSAAGGLNVAVRSLATPHGLILVPPSHPFDPHTILDALATAAGPVFLSLVPMQLSRILDTNPQALAHCHRILIGGASMSTMLRERSSHLPIVQTYGMTETAGGCVFNGTPAPGVGIDIDDGRVVVTGVTVAAGYLDTDQEFHGRFVTQDLGTFDDGRLTVTGRIDDVVLVRGTNVSLSAVADALGTSDACVVALPDDVDGSILCVAFTGMTDAQVQTHLDAVVARLGHSARPRRTRIVASLPLLHTGKIDRHAVQRMFEEGR